MSRFQAESSQLTGIRMVTQARSAGAAAMAKRSGASLARVLGDISPRSSTSTVITTVERVTPRLPNQPTNSTVARAVERMLTMLLPMRMEESRAS